ncbi:GNAT family N-acetyltransferase [Rhizobium cauense]|uniref:GNAT family N-acetyltransferase n=1 Tax=Rhizobium cauense TaxID=1166683 RepID=UPI001C6E4744|nr:GNAT family N-acetyltransferase [Rhizobium cauense]MBW9116421.1 GNAT family N-acetyltransferase [Rhizobium cauense]
MRQYAEALWGAWQPSSEENFDVFGHEVIEQDELQIGCVATTWNDDHLFIEKLYIAPAFQGKGIGARVLKTKVAQAARRGMSTKLSVLRTNPADRFYRREGFALESETVERLLFVKAM